jgi:hypothetical protein
MQDHWCLRRHAAQTVAIACAKYTPVFSDLQTRVCKTYVDGLSADRYAYSLRA